MKIFINDNPDLVSAEPGTPLVAIVDQLRNWLADNGLVMSRMELDGQALSLNDKERLGEALVDHYQRLEVTAAAPERLALDVIVGLLEMLPRLAANMQEAARQVQEGRPGEGLERFQGGIEGWSVMQESLGRISELLSLDLATFDGQGGTVTERLGHLGGLLQQIHQAIQGGDFVTIGDLLEYELTPLVDEWRQTLERLHQHVNQRFDATLGDERPA